MPGGERELPRVFGLGERAEWDAGADCQARSASYFGEIVTAGPRPPAARPRRMGKLMLVLARLWPVRVHPITDSNAPEAGDGPLPVAGGMAS